MTNRLLFLAKGGYCDVALFELILGLLGAFVKNDLSSLSIDVKGQSCSTVLAVHFDMGLTVLVLLVSMLNDSPKRNFFTAPSEVHYLHHSCEL